MQVCSAEDQRVEDLPLGRGDGGHRRHGERAEQEAAGGGEEDDEGDGVAFMQILMRMHEIYCHNMTLLFSPDWSKARRSCQQ